MATPVIVYRFEIEWDKEIGAYRILDTQTGTLSAMSYQSHRDAKRARNNLEFQS